MSTWRRHRAHRNSRASSIAPPRRGGLDDPRLPGNTALGAVRQCGSGRSLGRDHQVSTVRGCVSLLAESDLTPTHERRHRSCARCARAMGRQHRLRGETTRRPRRAHRDDSEQVRSDRYSQFTWPVRHLSALLRSHQHFPAVRGCTVRVLVEYREDFPYRQPRRRHIRPASAQLLQSHRCDVCARAISGDPGRCGGIARADCGGAGRVRSRDRGDRPYPLSPP